MVRFVVLLVSQGLFACTASGFQSGVSEVPGPGIGNQLCSSFVVKSDPFNSSEPQYLTTGVISSGDKYLVTGNSFNQLVVVDAAATPLKAFYINMTRGGLPVSNTGIVASGSVHSIVINSVLVNALYQPSDGNLFALDLEACIQGGQDAFDESFDSLKLVVPATALTAGEARLRTVHYVVDRDAWGSTHIPGDNPCVMWMVSSALGQPFYAPSRFMSPNSTVLPNGLVIAAETDQFFDSGGVLHALDPTTGVELWNHAAVFNGTSYGLYTVPAADISRKYLILLGYGPRFVALSPFTGAISAELNASAQWFEESVLGGDSFVSSTMLHIDWNEGVIDSVFVHSAAGTLWRINIQGTAALVNNNNNPNGPWNITGVTITLGWGCDYYLNNSVAQHKCVAFPDPSELAEMTDQQRSELRQAMADFDVIDYYPAGRPPTSGSSPTSISRRDLVGGGFPQPTTRWEREELFDEITRLYVARQARLLGIDATAVALPTDLSVQQMGKELGGDILASILTASGYRMESDRDRRGRARSIRRKLGSSLSVTQQRLQAGGLYPFATPSYLNLDSPFEDAVLVAQSPIIGVSALFALDATTGVAYFGYQNFTNSATGEIVYFEGSRASPAVDATGRVYAATDSWNDHFATPTLACLDPVQGSVIWLLGLGDSTGVVSVGEGTVVQNYIQSTFQTQLARFLHVVNAASPIVVQGPQGDSRVYQAASNGIIVVMENHQTPTKTCATNDDRTMCSSHGMCSCTANPTCTCNDGCAFGQDCALNECNMHGFCLYDTCDCQGCWAGDQCQDEGCVEGSCSTDGSECQCLPCWDGRLCDIPETCSGHGTCSDITNQCTCSDTFCYSGDYCELECNGWGTCYQNSTGGSACACNWCAQGPQCTQPNTCSGHGECNPIMNNFNGSCVCSPEECYTGLNCEVECGNAGYCDSSSGTAQCVCDNLCMTGPFCNETRIDCNSPHGMCNPATGTCVCDSCSNGQYCDLVCSDAGQCVNGACQCLTCFSGPLCHIQSSCSGHGVCQRNVGCQCDAGYGPPPNNPVVCQPCSLCNKGPNCGQAVTCSGHGTCLPNNGTCACNPGFDPKNQCGSCDTCHLGASCDTMLPACGDRGTCVPMPSQHSPYSCSCNDGWTGTYCSQAPASNSNVGAGVGTGVGITLAVAAVASVAGVIMWKRRNPLKPLSSLLPRSISGWIGAPGGMTGGGYSQLFTTSASTAGQAQDAEREHAARSSPIVRSAKRGYGT